MRYVIIGNGVAGNTAARAIRERDPGAEVLIYSDEPDRAYFRPLIANLLEEGGERDIFFPPGPASPGDAGVRLGEKIAALDPRQKQVALEDGKTVAYDRLLLATGAAAVLPDIPGLAGPGTFVLRTLQDAQGIAAAAGKAKNAVVLGAGRVGLKAALALKGRGLAVTLVEQGPHIAPMQFDAASGEILGRVLEAAGIRIFPGQTLAAVKRRDGGIQGLFLAGGRELAADLVIAAMGVRARTELARKAGLAVNQGVLVNPRLQAGDPAIFAAGDAVETFDPVTAAALVSGLWTNAVEMGKIAGSNMAGAAREYQGAFGVLNSLELAGVATIAIGVTNPPPGGGYEVHQLRRGNNYRKLVFREGRLAGALLLGEIEGAGIYAGLIRGKAQVTRPGEVLERPRAALASRLFSRPATAPRTISS